MPHNLSSATYIYEMQLPQTLGRYRTGNLTFLSRMFFTFLARTAPASSSAKPHCKADKILAKVGGRFTLHYVLLQLQACRQLLQAGSCCRPLEGDPRQPMSGGGTL
jgi:hypothetical protein